MSTLCEPKQDLRVTKTKLALSAAVFQLLEHGSFSRITVNDICTAAMVSRTTFYQHFPDKYELVRFAFDQAGGRLQESAGDDPAAAIDGMLEFTRANRRIFHNLLADGINEELIRKLSDSAVRSIRRDLERGAPAKDGIPAEIAAVFLSGGVAALLLWWIHTDFAMPREELAAHLLAMFRERREE